MAETLVYIARHVEAEINLHRGKVAGLSLESPPTEKGVGQADRLGGHFGRINFLPRLVASSKAERAKQTTRHVLDVIGREDQIVEEDKHLNEMSQGGWEGEDRHGEYETLMREGIKADGIDFRMTHPDGDGNSRREVADNMFEWLEDARRTGEGRIFAVSHRIAIVSLLAMIEGWPDESRGYEGFGRLAAPHDNATVNGLLFRDRQWNILFRARKPENLQKVV